MNISHAQEFNYGLSFGLGKTSATFNDERYNNSSNPETNYNLMALVYLPTNSSIRMQTGLKFFKVGHNVDVDIRTFTGPAPINYSTTFTFLAIPLNANYFLPFFSAAYLSGGIEGAYLLSASSNTTYKDNSSTQEKITNQFKKLNLFFAIGFGIDFPLDKITLFVRPEYTRSILEVTENSLYGSGFGVETIVLNIGLKF